MIVDSGYECRIKENIVSLAIKFYEGYDADGFTEGNLLSEVGKLLDFQRAVRAGIVEVLP